MLERPKLDSSVVRAGGTVGGGVSEGGIYEPSFKGWAGVIPVKMGTKSVVDKESSMYKGPVAGRVNGWGVGESGLSWKPKVCCGLHFTYTCLFDSHFMSFFSSLHKPRIPGNWIHARKPCIIMRGFLKWRFLLLGHPLSQSLAKILVMNCIGSFVIVGLNSAQQGSSCLLCPVLPLLWLNSTAGQLCLMLTKADCLLGLPSCILPSGISRILCWLKENFLSLLEMHPTYSVFSPVHEFI